MKIVVLGLFLTLSFACKKDDNPSDCMKLEGDWICASWTEEGQELIGSSALIISADIHFKTLTNNQGDYEMNIQFLIGGSEFIIGSYQVNANCDQITLTPKAGVPTVYHFTFAGNMLILDGEVNEAVTVMKFSKK